MEGNSIKLFDLAHTVYIVPLIFCACKIYVIYAFTHKKCTRMDRFHACMDDNLG